MNAVAVAHEVDIMVPSGKIGRAAYTADSASGEAARACTGFSRRIDAHRSPGRPSGVVTGNCRNRSSWCLHLNSTSLSWPKSSEGENTSAPQRGHSQGQSGTVRVTISIPL